MKTIRDVFKYNLIKLKDGRSQRDVALGAGIPYATYVKMEAGQIPLKSPEHLEGLVKFYGLRSSTELFLDPDPTKPTPEQAIKVLEDLVKNRQK